MNLKFIEFELDWPSELSVLDLKKHILSELIAYGKPLRWAITCVTNPSGRTIQKITIEATLIINDEKIP